MENELSRLLDLALKQGASYSLILKEIRSEVLAEYRQKYPESPQNVDVVLDAETGKIKLLSDGKDETPSDFAQKTAEIARGVILNTLEKETTSPTAKKSWLRFFFPLIFWGYNGLFFLYLVFFVLSLFNAEMRESVFSYLANIGWFQRIFLTILIATPLTSILYVLKTKKVKETSALGHLLFYFEIPLIIIAGFGASLTNPIPPVAFFLFLLLSIPFVLFLRKEVKQSAKPATNFIFVLVAQTAFMAVSYIVLLFTFYLPVIVGSLVRGYLSVILDIRFSLEQLFSVYANGMIISPRPRDPLVLILELTWMTIGGLILLAFISLPYVLTYWLWTPFDRARKALANSIGNKQTLTFNLALGFGLIAVMLALSYQPDRTRLLSKLEEFENLKTFEEQEVLAKDLVPKKEELRQTIKDSSDARQRYLFLQDETSLQRDYERTFGLNEEMASFIQKTFISAAHPFVYRGSTDWKQNYNLQFQKIFDEGVYERPDRPEMKAVSVLNREIEVTTSYNDLIANVSITEEYTTDSRRSEEVVYEFSLPHEAIITDLKLGPDLEHNGVIAPRGAARRTYEREVRQQFDPALLEQTGPRQWRLRVFPVPGKNDRTTLGGRNQKVQFTYVVGLTENGYPLPQYSRIINLDDGGADTTLRLNGNNLSFSRGMTNVTHPQQSRVRQVLCDQTQTLPISLPTDAISGELVPHRSMRALGDVGICGAERAGSLLPLVKNLRIAIMYDTSAKHSQSASLQEFRQLLRANPYLVTDNTISFYRYNDLLSKPLTLRENTLNQLTDVVHFGIQDSLTALQSLTGRYDLIIVVTNQAEFPPPKTGRLIYPRAPVYFVHTEGKIPAFERSFAVSLINYEGGVFTDIREALEQIGLSQSLKAQGNYLLLAPYWGISATPYFDGLEAVSITRTDDHLSYLVARGYLYGMMRRFPEVEREEPEALDRLHAYSERNQIVSPYSSLLALVDDRQREILRRESERIDRFSDAFFQPTQPFSGIDIRPAPSFGGFFGAEIRSLDISSAGSPAAMSAPGAGFSASLFAGNEPVILFILLNVVLVAVGLLVFLFHKFKSRLQNKEETN